MKRVVVEVKPHAQTQPPKQTQTQRNNEIFNIRKEYNEISEVVEY